MQVVYKVNDGVGFLDILRVGLSEMVNSDRTLEPHARKGKERESMINGVAACRAIL